MRRPFLIIQLVFHCAAQKATKCNEINQAEWWTPGHETEICTDEENLGSVCKIKCNAPYVSFNPLKPHDKWSVECKKPKNPTWVASYTGRPSNTCYFCPPWTYQTKKNRIIKKFINEQDTLYGIEMRMKFLPSNFGEGKSCGADGFVFALVFKKALPDDAVVDILGASVSYISVSRKVVTIKPHKQLNNIQNEFWAKDEHDGTRVTVFADDLTGIKGSYSVKLYLYCQNPAYDQIVDDLSCHDTPGVEGTTEEPECPTLPPTTTTTSTTTESTTSTTGSTTTSVPPTSSTTTGVVTTTDASGCVSGGSHYTDDPINTWPNGDGKHTYQGYFNVPIEGTQSGAWTMTVTFGTPVYGIDFWFGTLKQVGSTGKVWRFTSGETYSYTDNVNFKFHAIVDSDGGNTASSILFCPADIQPTTGTGTSTMGTTNSQGSTIAPTCSDQTPSDWYERRCDGNMQQGYCAAQPAQAVPDFRDNATDYEKLIHLSNLFYEMQRSGKLPDTNRIPWRGDTGLKDGCDVGHDLTGGWYDAGDYVKFNFPHSFAVTALAWGLIEFEDGYRAAGEYDTAVSNIKWATDYLIKCHTGPNEFWGQVADGHVDHAFWGRPEEYPSARPSFKIDQHNPGSDLAGEAAAALAASSIVFRTAGMVEYADECVQHAKELIDFADNFRGKYSDTITNVQDFYQSWSGYKDELRWGSAWVARATGSAEDLTRAENLYDALDGDVYDQFSWDEKTTGAQHVLYQLTKKNKYKNAIITNTNKLLDDNDYTPGGLIFYQKWGTARHASNAAFLCLNAVKHGLDTNNKFLNFARSQISYLMGNNPMNQNYIVGFTPSSPKRPHHASSSCPMQGECTWDAFSNSGPNPLILYGALVGGPNEWDQWSDDRSDYVTNEVTTDYNACWQGALAGLLQLDGDHVTTTNPPGSTTNPPVTTGPTVGPTCNNPAPSDWYSDRCNSNMPQGYCAIQPAQTTPNFRPDASDYEKLIHLSILFYEAQRAGKLSESNRIPWRGDTGLKDGCDVGHDLTGGWFDAGDYVKFNFPHSFSVTVLAWGLIEFEDGYRAAGEYDNAIDSIKWATDYLIKCHTAPNEFWGQVADGHVDHAFWGRPEEYPASRPAFKIDQDNPGSDLAGEAAAALAASSIVFRTAGMVDYADECLQHAKELFSFADTYRGKYSDVITNVQDFYQSWSGFKDELRWGSAWVARASGDPADLTKAEEIYGSTNGGAYDQFSWDEKTLGAQQVLYQLTKKTKYKNHVIKNTNQLIDSNDYTPGGLIFYQKWGSARHASNAAFLALNAVKHGLDTDNKFSNFAESQISYLMGNNPQNQNFIVGFNGNSPKRPHHASSSCPFQGDCTWDDFSKDEPNPITLYGALVGGPTITDQWADDREDYIGNEVTTDYNACWQGALAGLLERSVQKANDSP